MARRVPIIMMAVMAAFAAGHYFEGTPEAIALCRAELITAGLLGFLAVGLDVFLPRKREKRQT